MYMCPTPSSPAAHNQSIDARARASTKATRQPWTVWLILLALLLGNFGWAGAARAQLFPPSCTLSPSTLNVGTVSLAASGSATPQVGSLTFQCSNVPWNTAVGGVFSIIGTNNTPSVNISSTGSNMGTMTLPTNLQGVGLMITVGPPSVVYQGPYPTGLTTQTPGTFNITPVYGNNNIFINYLGANTVTLPITYQVVPISGQVITPGTLNQNLLTFGWNNSFPIFGGSGSIGNLTVTGNVTGGCSVQAGSSAIAVNLPSMDTSAFTGVGSTAGRTPFAINLNCTGVGTGVYVTMATNNAQPNVNGVIAPTSGSGYAANVGVQILNGQSTPVSFGTAQGVGNSTSTMTIPYYAQYYETAAPVSSGKVSATATFTLSYQ